jgi:hypothetical protein
VKNSIPQITVLNNSPQAIQQAMDEVLRFAKTKIDEMKADIKAKSSTSA